MEGRPLSQKGHDKLRAELDHLTNERRPQVTADIAKFRDDGDLKENAPYHAAREELGMIEAKIAELESILAAGFIVDMSKMPKGRVVFGTKVVVANEATGKDETYYLVGDGETDPDNGYILTTSPLGQAFIGKLEGDECVAELPDGDVNYTIKSISFASE